MNQTATPTLYEWLGGMPVLTRLTAIFYSRVPADPILGPVFARMSRSEEGSRAALTSTTITPAPETPGE